MRTNVNLDLHIGEDVEIEHSSTLNTLISKLTVLSPGSASVWTCYIHEQAREKLLRALLSPSEYRALRQAREEAA